MVAATIAIYTVYFMYFQVFIRRYTNKDYLVKFSTYIIPIIAGYGLYAGGYSYLLLVVYLFSRHIAFCLSFIILFIRNITWLTLAYSGFLGSITQEKADYMINGDIPMDYAIIIKDDCDNVGQMRDMWEERKNE